MDELLKRIHQLEVAVQNERGKNELLQETNSFLQKQLTISLFSDFRNVFRIKIMHRDRFELEYVPCELLDEITKRVSIYLINGTLCFRWRESHTFGWRQPVNLLFRLLKITEQIIGKVLKILTGE